MGKRYAVSMVAKRELVKVFAFNLLLDHARVDKGEPNVEEERTKQSASRNRKTYVTVS